MADIPRIAIGTVQPQADSTALVWALMDALGRAGVRVQSFLSHAYFSPRDGATAITGLPPRHLDSWLMSETVCREVFLRGCRTSDLAIVEGSFGDSPTPPGGGTEQASVFETLCHWLGLPRIAVIDAQSLSHCRLPERPAELDAIVLDRVHDEAECCRLQTLFEALWKVPVVGSLARVEPLRREIDQLPPGRKPSLELCHALGNEFARGARLLTILKLAASRTVDFSAVCPCDERTPCEAPSLRVAVAYDDAFGGYFPDTLDLLELRGAAIADFSPLADERLPPGTDVVYLGCGHPERFAAQLSKNDCLMLALKSHLCSGKRIYAECGGMAYLCHDIEMPEGHRWPMVGVLPATASFHPTGAPPTPTEVRLDSDTWLGGAGQCWRGYLNPRWSLRPTQQLEACAHSGAGREVDVVKRHQAVGSRLYLNFAAHTGMLESFFAPRPGIA